MPTKKISVSTYTYNILDLMRTTEFGKVPFDDMILYLCDMEELRKSKPRIKK